MWLEVVVESDGLGFPSIEYECSETCKIKKTLKSSHDGMVPHIRPSDA